MSNEKVSCLLTTYNRYPEYGFIVDEAVYSFIVQDYENKELLIINDTPGQELHIDEEAVKILGGDPSQIKIFNLNERFSSLPEKIAWGVEQATGDWLMRWDDDDICLHKRISISMEAVNSLKRLEWRCENYVYFRITQAADRSQVFSQESRYKMSLASEIHAYPTVVYNPANTHVMSIWNRKVLDGKRYPGIDSLSGVEDQAFNNYLRKMGYGDRGNALKPEYIFYIYRWGVSPRHLSGIGGWEHSDRFYREIGNLAIEKGKFEIKPRWLYNYNFVLSRAIENLKEKTKKKEERAIEKARIEERVNPE